jgi:hypothetical protein
MTKSTYAVYLVQALLMFAAFMFAALFGYKVRQENPTANSIYPVMFCIFIMAAFWIGA